MIPLSLIPVSNSVTLQSLDEEKDHFLLKLKTGSSCGLCPECGEKSYSRHSSYSRKLLDLPWAGTAVKVDLSVNKYYCKNEVCARKIFTERFTDEIQPYARRTARVNQHLSKIGNALGGNGGSRLASFIGIPISSSSVLRLISNAEQESEVVTPKVLGIDDWAFRKGHNYGTILVDLEKRKPIDLLPDREMETVKKWLEDHPGVEIISRDRASSYSKAAELGAPQAIQVADRWHLLKNLGDALKRMLNNYNKELRQTAKDIAQTKRTLQSKQSQKQQDAKAKQSMPDKNIPKQKRVLSKYELNFLEVKRLKAKGHSIKSIYRQTHINRETIRKYLKYENYPERAKTTSRPSIVLPFEPYLKKRWNEGQTNHKELFGEIKERGFTGSRQTVSLFISKHFIKPNTKNIPVPLSIKVWSTRKLSLLLSKPFENLEKEEQDFLRIFYKHCPQANKASQLARKFKEMTDKLRRKKLV